MPLASGPWRRAPDLGESLSATMEDKVSMVWGPSCTCLETCRHVHRRSAVARPLQSPGALPQSPRPHRPMPNTDAQTVLHPQSFRGERAAGQPGQTPRHQSAKGGKGSTAQQGRGGFGTRPWWLALLACGGAYWPLALEPSAVTSRHPHYCGHPRAWVDRDVFEWGERGRGGAKFLCTTNGPTRVSQR